MYIKKSENGTKTAMTYSRMCPECFQTCRAHDFVCPFCKQHTRCFFTNCYRKPSHCVKESYFICAPHLSEMAQVGALTMKPVPTPIYTKRSFYLPPPNVVKNVLKLGKRGFQFSKLSTLEKKGVATLHHMAIKRPTRSQ